MSKAPQGRLPTSVYRRRRITVAVIALLLVGLLVWGVVAVVSALGGEEKPPTANEQLQQPEPGQQPESEPESETASQSPEGMCAESDIELSAATDAASYTADQDPVLILQVKNASESECKINVGTSQQEFRVMSGSDRIFSTADCAQNGEDVILDFKPGQQENARFTWQKERSAPGCKAVNVQPRPGTYRFTALLGELESEPKSFELK